MGEEDTPRYNAILLLSILNIFNLITGAILVNLALNHIVLVNLPIPYLFLVGLSIIAVHAYIIFGKKTYLEIEQKYNNESEVERTINNLIACIYTVATIAIFIFCLVYLNRHPIQQGGIKY